jgi:hypothetical protein
MPNWVPTWSADGTQVAFVQARNFAGTKLMVMAADGSAQAPCSVRTNILIRLVPGCGAHRRVPRVGGKAAFRLFVAAVDSSR